MSLSPTPPVTNAPNDTIEQPGGSSLTAGPGIAPPIAVQAVSGRDSTSQQSQLQAPALGQGNTQLQ